MVQNANGKDNAKIITATGTKTGKLVGDVLNVTPSHGNTPEVKKPDEVKAPEKPQAEHPPLEDRILKVQVLSDLINKREKLMDSLKKITAFRFSSENRNDKLTIEDADNNEFTTTNTEVLAEVVNVIKATINKKIAEVNALIIF